MRARVLFGFGLAFAWLSCSRILRVEGTPHARGLSAWIDLSWATTTAAAIATTLLFMGALVAFVLRRAEIAAGAICVVLLALGEHVLAAQYPGNAGANRAVILPAAALVAYLVGRHYRSERTGIDAACGVAAACYLLAGLSKLTGSGAAWASAQNLALHIHIHSYGGEPALRSLRLAIAETPAVCAAFGGLTLLVECGFVFFVARRMRKPLAFAAVAMHVAIAVVMGLHHYDWMFVALGLALFDDEFVR